MGWSLQNANEKFQSWDMIRNSSTYPNNAHSGNQGMHLAFSMLHPNNDWLFTPPMQLEGGKSYALRFWFKVAIYQNSTTEKMGVYIGTDNDSTAMNTTSPLFYDTEMNNEEWIEHIAPFTPDSNGVYYFGFHGFSDALQWLLYVDDVMIEEDNVNHNPCVTSTIYNVDDSAEIISNIPFGTTLSEFELNVDEPLNGSYEIYENDGITVANDLQSGYQLHSVAEDGYTTKIYFIEINPQGTYDVTFNVIEGTTPVAEAVITLGTVTKLTNASGIAVFNNVLENSYTYSVTKTSYQAVNGNLTLNSDTTIEISLEKITYNATFIVKNALGTTLEGAILKINEENFTTDAQGQVIVEKLLPKTYTFSVEKESFNTFAGSLTLNSDTIINVILSEATYSVTFSVLNINNNEPIADAVVTFNSESMITDAQGKAVFEAKAGDYTYQVEKDGYTTTNGTVKVINIPVGMPVLLVPTTKTCTISFTVKEEQGNVIANASIYLKNIANPSTIYSGATDAQGKLSLNNVNEGQYACVVMKENLYIPFVDTLNFSNDTSLQVTLKNIYKVTFVVKDKANKAIANASVSMLDTVVLTDANGKIEDLLPAGTYPYQIWKTGYNTIRGTLTVTNADITETLILAALGINTFESKISIYPNPVSSQLTVEAERNSYITILNVDGKIFVNQPITSEKTNVDVSKFAKGIYFLQIRKNNKVEIHKFVVK